MRTSWSRCWMRPQTRRDGSGLREESLVRGIHQLQSHGPREERKLSQSSVVSGMPLRSLAKSDTTFLAAGDQASWLAALKRIGEALINAEPEITKYDQVAGDGDAGLTLKAGAEGG